MKITVLAAGAALALTTLFGTTSVMAQDGEALAKAKNCLACHSVDKKVVGPSYKDVAAKFADDPGAVDMLADRIKNGSSGVWGAVPMPPNNVTEAEAKELAEWVMSLK